MSSEDTGPSHQCTRRSTPPTYIPSPSGGEPAPSGRAIREWERLLQRLWVAAACRADGPNRESAGDPAPRGTHTPVRKAPERDTAWPVIQLEPDAWCRNGTHAPWGNRGPVHPTHVHMGGRATVVPRAGCWPIHYAGQDPRPVISITLSASIAAPPGEDPCRPNSFALALAEHRHVLSGSPASGLPSSALPGKGKMVLRCTISSASASAMRRRHLPPRNRN